MNQSSLHLPVRWDVWSETWSAALVLNQSIT